MQRDGGATKTPHRRGRREKPGREAEVFKEVYRTAKGNHLAHKNVSPSLQPKEKPPFTPLPLHFKILFLIFIRVHSRKFAANSAFAFRKLAARSSGLYNKVITPCCDSLSGCFLSSLWWWPGCWPMDFSRPP